MRVLFCVACLLLCGVMNTSAGINKPLSQIAGVPVYVYSGGVSFNQVLSQYNYPGYPTSFAMYEVLPEGSRIHLSPFVSTTLTRMLNGWQPGRDKRAAFAILALAREMGHVAIGDPMHGQLGHNDPGATAWAIKNYRQIAKELGIRRDISSLRGRALRVLRQWENGNPPTF